MGRLRTLAGTAASVPITLFGLVLVTFLIGRVMPIDPTLAIVGDHAPPDVVARCAFNWAWTGRCPSSSASTCSTCATAISAARS